MQKNRSPNQDVLINEELADGASKNINLNFSETNSNGLFFHLPVPIVILTEQPKSTYVHLENYTKGASHEPRALLFIMVYKCLTLSHKLTESNSISLAMPQVDDPNLTIEPNKSECIVRVSEHNL